MEMTIIVQSANCNDYEFHEGGNEQHGEVRVSVQGR